jgi:hypothetical protein
VSGRQRRAVCIRHLHVGTIPYKMSDLLRFNAEPLPIGAGYAHVGG